MNMTWKEFKDFVDKELASQNLDGDVEIEYIDISNPDLGHESTMIYVGYDGGTMAVFM